MITQKEGAKIIIEFKNGEYIRINKAIYDNIKLDKTTFE